MMYRRNVEYYGCMTVTRHLLDNLSSRIMCID